MSIRICDRCGVITVGGEGCICTTPYSLSEIRRRHQAAVASARIITAAGDGRAWVESGENRATAASTPPSPARPNSVVDNGVVPRRTAAAAIPGERAQARVPNPDSMSRPGNGAAETRTDTASPVPPEAPQYR